MANTTIKETSLAFAVQQNLAVRSRIEAIVRDKLWDDPNADPTVSLPIDDLAWAVVSVDAIRKTVRDALDANEPNIAKAVDSITDGSLLTAVTSAMTRLKIGVPPSA